jgi:hypothetical protein
MLKPEDAILLQMKCLRRNEAAMKIHSWYPT